MNKRIEIDMNKSNEDTRIDLKGICADLDLRYLQYEEDTGQKDQTGTPIFRTVFFIHERGLETGLRFVRKREMAEQMVLFHAARLRDNNTSLVSWGGRRGLPMRTTVSAEERALRRQAAAEAA